METKELRTDLWKASQKENNGVTHYDELMDTLFMYFSKNEEETIITHFVDEYVAFLYRQSDNQIVGIRIEYFKDAFLPANAENKIWKLSSTGKELNGIRDLGIRLEIKEVKPKPTPIIRQYTIPKPINKNVELEPVFS